MVYVWPRSLAVISTRCSARIPMLGCGSTSRAAATWTVGSPSSSSLSPREGGATDGLSHWLVRSKPSAGGELGDLVEVAGVTRRPGPVWNLWYRLSPEAHGRGYASEVAAAACHAARATNAEVPVVAYLVKHDHASRRTAERAGHHLVWQGADFGNPDPHAVRLIDADRQLAPELLNALTHRT